METVTKEQKLEMRVKAIEMAMDADPTLGEARVDALRELRDGWVPMTEHLEGRMGKGGVLFVRRIGESKPHVLLTRDAFEAAQKLFNQERGE